MCNIAGYAGNKHAAPVVIDMLRREEKWDAYMSTGVCSLNNGRLYRERTLGPVENFLDFYGPDDFPGNVALAHSRSRGDYLWRAHPFVDSKHTVAVVLNGIGRETECKDYFETIAKLSAELKAQGYFEKRQTDSEEELKMGYPFTEIYAAYIARAIDRGANIPQALAEVCSAIPGDFVTVMMHKAAPGKLYVCRVTRPMFAAVCDGETYIATTHFAFGEDIKPKAVFSLPCCTVCEISAGGVNVTPYHLTGVSVEDVRPHVYSRAMDQLLTFLEKRRDTPCDFDTMEDELYRNIRDVWEQPLIDCKFKSDNGCLKQYARVLYELLFELHKQDKLEITSGIVNGRTRFLVRLK